MRGRRALIVGWGGGVGNALLRLLAAQRVGQELAERLDAIVLSPCLDLDGLRRVLRDEHITQVIEVADVDTLAFSAICSEYGADYLSASVQNGDELTMPLVQRIVAQRPDVGEASHLFGAGMNPGIVNALVLAGFDELTRRARHPPELYAIYITERDTTAAAQPLPSTCFSMSWSPHHALQELLEPRAMYVADGRLVVCDHAPAACTYALRCGADEIRAMVIPHEEVVTVGTRFTPVECAFCYEIPAAAAEALRRAPARSPKDWQTWKLYPPHEVVLVGRDRVGVLLCSRDAGELWIGFETSLADGARYGSNATLLQAATGVLAGWSRLGERRAIHFVEDLDWRAFLSIVEQVLGPAQVHHDPHARVRTLAQRRVD